jgi:hypothetical protein
VRAGIRLVGFDRTRETASDKCPWFVDVFLHG